MILRKLIVFTLFVCCNISQIMAQSECIIADYPFNNSADNTISNNFNGIIYGPQIDEDRDGNLNSAYLFDGIGDYISIENQPVISSTNFTITVWANMQGSGGGPNERNPIFVQRNNIVSSTSSLIALFAQYVDNKVTFLVRNQASGNIIPISVEGGLIDFNEWHFYAAVKDSSFLRLYIDGIEVGAVSCPVLGPFNTGTDHVDIGRHYYSGTAKSFFNGYIDDVEIFNCALSEVEIQEIYEPVVNPPFSVENEEKNMLTLFPNPTNDILTLKLIDAEEVDVELYTLTGQVLAKYKISEDLTMDISHLPEAPYFVKVINERNFKVYKFLKTE